METSTPSSLNKDREQFFHSCHAGCVGYTKDLDRFINGQIEFEEIQGYIKNEVHIQDAIRHVLKGKCTSKEKHDLYEKLCYATVLYSMRFYSPSSLYSEYLVAKEVSSPHKLNWENFLKKIKKEFNMNSIDIVRGQGLYEDYKSGINSSWLSDDSD